MMTLTMRMRMTMTLTMRMRMTMTMRMRMRMMMMMMMMMMMLMMMMMMMMMMHLSILRRIVVSTSFHVPWVQFNMSPFVPKFTCASDIRFFPGAWVWLRHFQPSSSWARWSTTSIYFWSTRRCFFWEILQAEAEHGWEKAAQDGIKKATGICILRTSNRNSIEILKEVRECVGHFPGLQDCEKAGWGSVHQKETPWLCSPKPIVNADLHMFFLHRQIL